MLEYGDRPMLQDKYMENYFLGFTIGLIGGERQLYRDLLRLKRNANANPSEKAAKEIHALEKYLCSNEYKKDRLVFYDRYASLSNESWAKKIWKESEYWQGGNNLPI